MLTGNLRERELFSGFSDAEFDKLATTAKTCGYAAGTRIFEMGGPSTHISVITEGQVDLKLPVTILGTSKEITVESLVPGQMVGWSSLVRPFKFTMSAVAAVDCALVSYSSSDTLDILASDAKLCLKFMSNLAAVIGRQLGVTQAILFRQLQNEIDYGFLGPGSFPSERRQAEG